MAASIHQRSLQQTLERAGARKVLVALPKTLPELQNVYQFQSVEVLSLCLKAASGGEDFPDALLWKKKLPIAQALLAPSKQAKAVQSVALKPAVVDAVLQKHARKGKKSGSPDLDEDALHARAYVLLGQAESWMQRVKAKPEWKLMRPFLMRIVDAGVEPVPQVSREGFSGEAYVYNQLNAALQPGWSCLASVELGLGGLVEGGPGQQKGVKGIKGEVDIALCDPAGVCQAIVEVKLGGDSPYRSLYNDNRKLRRLLDLVAGREVPTGEHREGLLRFSPHTTPLYVVLRDGEPLDGLEVLTQAEAHLVKINLSMALGSASAWRGAELAPLSSQHVELQLRKSLAESMRKKVARDFSKVVASVDVYEMSPPAGQTWAW